MNSSWYTVCDIDICNLIINRINASFARMIILMCPRDTDQNLNLIMISIDICQRSMKVRSFIPQHMGRLNDSIRSQNDQYSLASCLDVALGSGS